MELQSTQLTAADLDGDGRDELLLYYDGFLHAWDHDLKDRWFWPARSGTIDQVVPPSRGLPGVVIVPPGLGSRWGDGAAPVDGTGASGGIATAIHAQATRPGRFQARCCAAGRRARRDGVPYDDANVGRRVDRVAAG